MLKIQLWIPEINYILKCVYKKSILNVNKMSQKKIL